MKTFLVRIKFQPQKSAIQGERDADLPMDDAILYFLERQTADMANHHDKGDVSLITTSKIMNAEGSDNGQKEVTKYNSNGREVHVV